MSIHAGCRKGDLEAVRKLVEADPLLVNADDEHKWRPIFHASLKRHAEVVRYLIDRGADLSAHNGGVLHYASEVPDNKEIVRLLVQFGAMDAHVQPTSDLSRQLFAALFLGESQRLAALLKFHPNLATDLDGRGDAPLHHAARCGETEIVKLLLDAGADVHGTTPRGHTVLYCAGGHGHVEAVELLLSRGADPDVRFTHDDKKLSEWLAQYPDDSRLSKVAALFKKSE